MLEKWEQLLLRLFAVCAIPTECKLVLITGERNRSSVSQIVVPWMLEMWGTFDRNSEHYKQVEDELYHYIFKLQAKYYKTLNRLGLCGTWEMYIEREWGGDRDLNIRRIYQLARKLHQIDGTSDDMVNLLYQKYTTSRTKTFMSSMSTDLQGSLNHARAAWQLYTDFVEWSAQAGFEYLIDPAVVTIEYTNYLGHFCRAYANYLRGAMKETVDSDLGAGVKHLKRATLDINKGIISSALEAILVGRLDRDLLIGEDIFTGVLSNRQKEAMLPPDSYDKISLLSKLAP